MAGELFWVLGAGRFGSLAVRRLLECREACRLVVVDREDGPLAALGGMGVERVLQDAVDFLLERFPNPPDWVVPAVPLHVAFAWLCLKLSREGAVRRLEVPAVLEAQVPHPFRDRTGGLCTSYATFRCPDHCEEPEDRCTVTGKPRPPDLFSLLSRLEVPGYLVRVIRSHQLAPGVGGYRPEALRQLHEAVRSAGKPAVVATACRCHGIVHALRFLAGVSPEIDR